MSGKNKHIKKAAGISLFMIILAFFIGDSSNTNTAVYLLFVGAASFASVYLISMITAKAYRKFAIHNGGH
ncbi:hypothetical protein [Domibacillus indicus]|uniref:hypothetical protein n=1 Tax=Domibacillus indicus TaxID=1437523 RepID=UPI000617EA01|nr:hypothetical protein [Domibacillus indicus]